MKRLFFVLAASLLTLPSLHAQRQSYVDWRNQDMDSLLMWFKDGPPTDFSRLKDLEFKRSHVRPRKVIVDQATQLDPSIDPRRSVFANLPVGGNDLLTGLPSGNFDEDVFSVWPYVKVHGNWSNPWFTAPAAYSDAAHKHGTAVLSSWFFGWDWPYAAGKTKAEDADAYKIEMMTKKDAQGNFIYAEPMINIMQYFGMDGINYNSECFFKAASTDMQALHKKLYAIAKERDFHSFHVGWYNSVSNDGTGHGGRSTLSGGENWFYNNGEFVSDAFMLDYGWGTSALASTVATASSTGAPNGALDVYAGMWLVSIGQGYFPALDANKQVSIGLWGEHKLNRFFQHRSGVDLRGVQKSYQDRLEWFFTGKTRNPLDAKTNTIPTSGTESVENDSYLQSFHGIAKHVAERSAVQGNLPFATSFNLGNGLSYYDRGVKTLGGWYNLSAQDMMPTYRWLITNPSGSVSTDVAARFSHDDAWTGGSTLLIEGTAGTAPTDITLYRANLGTKKNDAYSAKPVKPTDFTVESVEECAEMVNLKMVWSMSAENRTRLVYNDEVNVDHFEIWLKELGKEQKKVAHTASWAHFLPAYQWEENATTFDVGVRAVAQDLVTTSDMTWTTVTRDPAASAVPCAGGAYCAAVNDLGQAPDAHLTRYFDSAYTVGADANIKVYGQAATTPGLEGYASFLNDTVKVTRGQTFTFRANATVNMKWCKYRVYADWNGDGEFDPDAEMIVSGGKDNAGDETVCSLNFPVVVPVDAAFGATRLRVRYSDAWVAHPGACGKAAGGYTADFSILVTGGESGGGGNTPGGSISEPPAFTGPTLNAITPIAYLVYKLDGGAAGAASNLALLLKKKGASAPVAYPLGNAALEGWNEVSIPLSDYAETDTIVSIGLQVQAATGSAPVKAYIGELKLLPGSYRRSSITVSAMPTVTDFTITSTSGVTVSGADTLVDYGSPLEFTFKVTANAGVPAVTVNGASTSCTYDAAIGVYAVSIASVTEDLSISIAASQPRTVTVTKSDAIAIVTASGSEIQPQRYEVADGSAFTLTFRVDGEGYDVPVVATGSAAYPLAPAAGGVYTVTIGVVDADTGVSISVALRQLAVSVAAGDHVALQTPAAGTVAYGDSCVVRFTLDAGYNPVVAIGGAEQPAPTADAEGVYTVTVSNVTAAVSVSVSAAIQQLDVTLTRDESNISLRTGTTAGTKKVSYGDSFAFSFEVITAGYLPVLKVNSVEVDLNAPDADGVYRDTVYNITAATTIDISAKLEDDGGGNGSTGVEALAADAPRFFPNPASDALTFVNTEKVSIYTVSGTLMGVYTEASISIAHLPAGIYVVKMQRGSYTRTAQLVKN
jgi:endo-beta-N-acetylglucosaminidase D